MLYACEGENDSDLSCIASNRLRVYNPFSIRGRGISNFTRHSMTAMTSEGYIASPDTV
jgi:hypothetical protein